MTAPIVLDLDAIEEAAKAATPGQWTLVTQGIVRLETPNDFVAEAGGFEDHDAKFVAATNPSVVLELVRRLRAADAAVSAKLSHSSELAGITAIHMDLSGHDIEQLRHMFASSKADDHQLIVMPLETKLEHLDEEQMRQVGWVRADASVPIQEAWEAAGGNPGIKAGRDELLSALRLMDEADDDAEQKEVAQKGKASVDADALRQVLQALIGPAHHIRELQACRCLPGSPIDKLVAEFNAQGGGA